MAKRKLDILIPMYKETEDIVKPLLDSIQIQHSINLEDVGVIICSDGDEEDNSVVSDLLMSIYDFHIEFHREKHGGVSATRNKCFSYSDAEYVMWCDCDDMFFNALGMRMIFDEIENSHFDALVSCFIEEGKLPGTNRRMYLPREIDHTFVHGKIFRAEYLREKDIHFFENCTVHEDHSFVALAIKCAGDRAVYMPSPFYLWAWNDNSVCRRDPMYILKTYRDMLKSNTELVRQFVKRDMEEEAINTATQMCLDAYFSMNTKQWIDVNNKEYRDLTEKRFKEYWTEFKYLYEKAKEETKFQITASIRQRFYQEGLLFEEMTWNDWIKHIENL